jgi:hypothetical protein
MVEMGETMEVYVDQMHAEGTSVEQIAEKSLTPLERVNKLLA